MMTRDNFSLHSQEVHLWRLNLEAATDEWQQESRHLLSTDEEIRAQKFKRGMNDFINTRIFMRKVLSLYVGIAAHELQFNANAYGKPFLIKSDIQFNLSHSRQWAVLAVGSNCDLGIDVESTSDRRSILNVAQHHFHPDEVTFLKKITNDEKKHDYFFQLWTLKESFVKALGTGISTGLDKMSFSIDDRESITAIFSPELRIMDPTEWHFAQYDLHDASVKNWCAVAVRSRHTVQIKWMQESI